MSFREIWDVYIYMYMYMYMLKSVHASNHVCISPLQSGKGRESSAGEEEKPAGANAEEC